MKRVIAMLLAVLSVCLLLAGCTPKADPSGTDNPTGAVTAKPADNGGKPGSDNPAAVADDLERESPMLAEMVAAGKLPAVGERLPIAADIMVETEKTPDNPKYGGTLRRNNGGQWDFGPFCEEPLFRLTEDGGVTANVAKGYDVSADGLTYTVYLREGMKWSDGEPFTAEDVVYYYNYMLITDVNPETGAVTNSFTGNYYNWYKTTDPADGLTKPAIITKVDDYTFQIKLYAPKPLILQAIAIDNKWMFAPKHWYKDIVAFDSSKPHWSGVEDAALVGGNGLTDLTEEQAVKNAAAKSELYQFDNYTSLGNALGYLYWNYAGRPTLRAWNITSALTETVLVFERNPYFWKTDAAGRQLPYMDYVEMVTMDNGLYAQEMLAGNIDMNAIELPDLATYKAGETTGNYTVYSSIQPNWTSCSVELNQSYKDEQYAELFSNIDFRHALSIAVDRHEMNEILYNGLAEEAQCAAPNGTDQYVEGASEKWTEYNPDAANALLDGIDTISNDLNADGYRYWLGGANEGQTILILLEGHEKCNSASAIALLAKYYKAIGIQMVEVSNTARNTRQSKVTSGNEVMALYEENLNVFNPAVRPDRVGANRNICTWVGLYGLEHANPLTPKAGSEMEKVVENTKKLATATTVEEAKECGDKMVQSMIDNTWIIGFCRNTMKLTALSNKVKNYDPNYISCDELRFYGNTKPYTWFIEE